MRPHPTTTEDRARSVPEAKALSRWSIAALLAVAAAVLFSAYFLLTPYLHEDVVDMDVAPPSGQVAPEMNPAEPAVPSEPAVPAETVPTEEE